MNAKKLECWAFWWSEIRLFIAAIALLLGGIPPLYFMFPGLGGVSGILRLCWLISGVVAAYQGYLWYEKKTVFGGKDTWDQIAAAFMIVTGINLGLAGLLLVNIGMSIIAGRVIFFVAGIVYIAVAVYLYRRWRASGKVMF